MFHRIKFRRIWRKTNKSNIIWNFKFIASVLTSAIKNHDNLIVRMPCCDFIKKCLHTISVNIRQYKRIHFTVTYCNSSISISIFLGIQGRCSSHAERAWAGMDSSSSADPFKAGGRGGGFWLELSSEPVATPGDFDRLPVTGTLPSVIRAYLRIVLRSTRTLRPISR